MPAANVQAVFSAPFDRRTWLAASYVVLGTLIGAVTGTIVLAFLLLVLGLSWTVVGAVAVLGLALACSRRLGRGERTRAEVFLGLAIADPHESVDGRWWQRVITRATRAQSWKEVAYLFLLLPVGLVGCGLVAGTWTGAIVLLLLPLYNFALPNGGAHLPGLVVDGVPELVAVAAAGAGLALAAPWIARFVASLEGRLARTLLGPSPTAALVSRVGQLEQRREQMAEVVEAERRRIERDLHDGAQQRLVALALDLGMAREKFDRDPEAARALLESAHDEAKRAMVELRNLARGIHPAVLSDRGLDAALSSLAGRAPVPVELTVDLAHRPPAAIETIAYFVVAEALTNVARHARATGAIVRLAGHDGRLVIEITDDGVGGADPQRGTGLAGLRDRVTAVDGRLRLDSPTGGPTTLLVEIPCAS